MTNNSPTDYSDIINLPRHISMKRQPISLDNRAAQFAPYAALVGHKDIVTQNESLASTKIDLDHDISLTNEDY